MAPMAHIISRGEGSSKTPAYTIIAGFCIAGALLVFCFTWLGIRYYRKRSRTTREDSRGSAFLVVVGVVKDESPPSTWTPVHDPNLLSVPENAVTHLNPSRNAIVQQSMRTKICPQPTTTIPPNKFESGFRRQPPIPIARESVFSINSVSTRFSAASVASSTISMSKRKVRQMFDPIMSDELAISHGERLAVMQSFQDGWCIVCRPMQGNPDDVEIGVIPAWCFLKPVMGLRAKRPPRLVSLGVTAQIEQSHYPSRPDVFSWSNF